MVIYNQFGYRFLLLNGMHRILYIHNMYDDRIEIYRLASHAHTSSQADVVHWQSGNLSFVARSRVATVFDAEGLSSTQDPPFR